MILNQNQLKNTLSLAPVVTNKTLGRKLIVCGKNKTETVENRKVPRKARGILQGESFFLAVQPGKTPIFGLQIQL